MCLLLRDTCHTGRGTVRGGAQDGAGRCGQQGSPGAAFRPDRAGECSAKMSRSGTGYERNAAGHRAGAGRGLDPRRAGGRRVGPGPPAGTAPARDAGRGGQPAGAGPGRGGRHAGRGTRGAAAHRGRPRSGGRGTVVADGRAQWLPDPAAGGPKGRAGRAGAAAAGPRHTRTGPARARVAGLGVGSRRDADADPAPSGGPALLLHRDHLLPADSRGLRDSGRHRAQPAEPGAQRSGACPDRHRGRGAQRHAAPYAGELAGSPGHARRRRTRRVRPGGQGPLLP